MPISPWTSAAPGALALASLDPRTDVSGDTAGLWRLRLARGPA